MQKVESMDDMIPDSLVACRTVRKEEPYLIIGIIDAYGAIHHRPVMLGCTDKMHDYYWPGQTHKRWRLIISDWQLSNSCLSKDNLTEAESEDIYALLRKHYTPPKWLIKGEEWEALGRPHSGKAYEEHTKKWDKIYGR